MQLEEKLAIVTGGASGIGRAISTLFAQQGARVVVIDQEAKAGEDTVALIESQNGTADFIRCDVSNPEQVQKMAKKVHQTWNKINILINNAGVLRQGSIVDTEIANWDLVLDVNLKGVFLCSKYIVPYFSQKGGSIINIASIGGLVGPERLAAYAAAKAGVINLTRQMATDLGPLGIRVNAICPGNIRTPMLAKLLSSKERQKNFELTLARSPLRRAGRPEDIAQSALYLASESANFVTGAILVVDGGVTAAGAR